MAPLVPFAQDSSFLGEILRQQQNFQNQRQQFNHQSIIISLGFSSIRPKKYESGRDIVLSQLKQCSASGRQYKHQILLMLSENYKVIDNYTLEEMVHIYPNSTQLWSVRHIVLKKRFTFKKLKFTSNPNRDEPATPTFNRPKSSQYQKLVSETNLLKKLNLNFAPKCYKIIKTSNHIYVVYEEFPSLTLKQYLDRQTLSRQQKNSLMQNLASSISQIGSKSIAIVGLNLENIFVKDNLQIFFGDWTLSKILGTHQKCSLNEQQSKDEFIANQIREEGKVGVWSDIFSLGKIYKAILNYYHLANQNEYKKNLDNLIERMINRNYKERPNIKEVIKTLNEHFSQILTKSTLSWTFQEDSPNTKQLPKTKCRLKQRLTIQVQSIQKLPQKTLKLVKSAKNFMSHRQKPSTNHLQTQQTQRGSTPTATPKQFSKIKTSSQEETSNLRLGRRRSEQKLQTKVASCKLIKNIDKKQNDEEKQLKKINNKRNLSFFIADLAEFVSRTELNNQLTFMLMKYSELTYKETLEKWKNKILRSKEATSFTNIMEKEIEAIERLVNLYKEQFNTDQYKASYAFKKELEQANSINDALMKIKILQFAKDILLSCQKYDLEKTLSIKKIDVLFKTYLILKKIQEGNFQKFWKKVTNEDQIYLSNQKYLKEEKNYGLRYIKSKITEIISNK